jgi:RluA family pseudouridine synthase
MKPPKSTPSADLIYLDEQLAAVNKPAGFVSGPGHGDEPSAIDWLRGRPELADNPVLRVVHRLDREASGVLLYARTVPAQRQLVAAFAEQRVEQVYHTLVCGHVATDGEVNLRLGFHRKLNRVITVSSSGKSALTRYRVVQRFAGHTLLECQPVTGRLQQIRAHLAAIGHPLSIDPLYGGGDALFLSHYKPDYHPSRRREERPLMARLTLHALRLTFPHPSSGTPFTIIAPLPKDFRATLTQLGRLVAREPEAPRPA